MVGVEYCRGIRFFRDNSSVHQATTSDGYYQYELSQGLSQLYMINVFVDSDQLVPVVSVDRRRLLLKFNYMSVADKSKSPHVIHGDKVDFSLGIGAL